MGAADFLAESIAAVRAAKTYADLHRIYAERITALINDGGTMPDLRALAQAWRDRNDELLTQRLEK